MGFFPPKSTARQAGVARSAACSHRLGASTGSDWIGSDWIAGARFCDYAQLRDHHGSAADVRSAGYGAASGLPGRVPAPPQTTATAPSRSPQHAARRPHHAARSVNAQRWRLLRARFWCAAMAEQCRCAQVALGKLPFVYDKARGARFGLIRRDSLDPGAVQWCAPAAAPSSAQAATHVVAKPPFQNMLLGARRDRLPVSSFMVWRTCWRRALWICSRPLFLGSVIQLTSNQH